MFIKCEFWLFVVNLANVIVILSECIVFLGLNDQFISFTSFACVLEVSYRIYYTTLDYLDSGICHLF